MRGQKGPPGVTHIHSTSPVSMKLPELQTVTGGLRVCRGNVSAEMEGERCRSVPQSRDRSPAPSDYCPEETVELALMRIRARGDWFPVFLAFCSAGGYLETLSRDDLA